MQNQSAGFTISPIIFYAAESFVGIILALIFLYFSKAYNRHFIRMWSFSWAAFSLSMMALIFVTLVSTADGVSRHFFSFVSLALQLYQILFLLAGSYELVRYQKTTSKNLAWWSAAIVIVAACVVLPFSTDDSGAHSRYLLRLGGRYIVIAAGFVAAGYITIKASRFEKGIGKTLIAISFVAYGIYHFYYLFIVVTNVVTTHYRYPHVFGFVELIIVNVTGLSMAIWLLEDKRLALAKANKKLDDFYYRVSHDLRAPIATMSGIANLAKLDLKEPESLKLMGMMESNLFKLERVIREIVQISKNRQIEVREETINFNKLMADIWQTLNKKEKAALVKLIYEENEQNVLTTDPRMLKEILANLLDNAVEYNRYNQAEPHVKVTFMQLKDKVQIVVEDSGIGMSPEVVPRIFDMFYRGHSISEGTGLGLYKVRELLEKLNASISVRSIVGSGSIFIIDLPRL